MVTKLEAMGYKSLQRTEVGFGPLAVVVGPNNAGKSNFFDLLQLLSAFATGPLDKAFDRHRGDPVEAFHDPSHPVMEAKLTIDLRRSADADNAGHRPPRAPLDYELAVKFDTKRALFQVVRERLDWVPGTPSPRRLPFIGPDDDGQRLRVTREGGGAHPRYFERLGTRTVLS